MSNITFTDSSSLNLSVDSNGNFTGEVIRDPRPDNQIVEDGNGLAVLPPEVRYAEIKTAMLADAQCVADLKAAVETTNVSLTLAGTVATLTDSTGNSVSEDLAPLIAGLSSDPDDVVTSIAFANGQLTLTTVGGDTLSQAIPDVDTFATFDGVDEITFADGGTVTLETDTDAQVLTSPDGSLVFTPVVQPDGRVDYEVEVARCLPDYTVGEDSPLSFDRPTIIAPLNGHCSCVGAVWAVVAGSEVNIVSVTINADGTHTVLPDPAACFDGSWSYEYTETCPGSAPITATVRGVFDTTPVPVQTFSIESAAGETHDLGLVLKSGGTFSIDWGDGTISSGVTSTVLSAETTSHTYASAFSGDVTILASACDEITDFKSLQGGWNFNLSILPESLLTFVVADNNTTFGDIANMPVGLTFYQNSGNNTTFGDIGNLPTDLLEYRNLGNNTTTGDIANLPTDLIQYINQGSNTTFGDISNLPAVLTFYRNQGSNTTTGDIAALPAGLTSYQNEGSNTTFGDVAGLPAGLTRYINRGSNTTSGDIATLPAGLTYYLNQGSNTVDASGTTWSAATAGFQLFLNYGGWTTAQVDNALIALTSVTSWAAPANVNVAGSNAAPSAAGLAAITTILANGANSVVTN